MFKTGERDRRRESGGGMRKEQERNVTKKKSSKTRRKMAKSLAVLTDQTALPVRPAWHVSVQDVRVAAEDISIPGGLVRQQQQQKRAPVPKLRQLCRSVRTGEQRSA